AGMDADGGAGGSSPAGPGGPEPGGPPTASSASADVPPGEEGEGFQNAVNQLEQIDSAVKAHERAHAAVGGQYAGAPTYTYMRGPDGQQYAVAGEVSIDLSPGRTLEATIDKMEVVISAALAPADPSAQDQSVAQKAQQIKSQAEAALAQQDAPEAETGQESEESGELDALSTPLAAQAASQSEEEDTETGSADAQMAMQGALDAYRASAGLLGPDAAPS
ncbi:MAG: hypothetical protein KI785_10875, partial [Devosiaceae bacterium]|nr:hypothetical protein [Devosiaceae bacterium MH13]